MTLQDLWDEFAVNNLRPESPREDVLTLKKMFFAGALALLGELIQTDKAVFQTFHDEISQFEKEVKSEDKRRDDST